MYIVQEETCLNRRDILKERVKMMVTEELVGDPLRQLEMVDELQRLGLSYHFEKEINEILEIIMNDRLHGEKNHNMEWKKNNLYATALQFRILRQHGYHVPQGERFYFLRVNNNECL